MAELDGAEAWLHKPPTHDKPLAWGAKAALPACERRRKPLTLGSREPVSDEPCDEPSRELGSRMATPDARLAMGERSVAGSMPDMRGLGSRELGAEPSERRCVVCGAIASEWPSS